MSEADCNDHECIFYCRAEDACLLPEEEKPVYCPCVNQSQRP